MAKECTFCGQEIEDHLNFCSWDCAIEAANAAGGSTIAPNNLPVTCIKFDNTMLEHEHADHEGYKFPVIVEYTGTDFAANDDLRFRYESHALLHTCGNAVLTIYESTYFIWRLDDGRYLGGGACCYNSDWKLTSESLKKVQSIHKSL